MKDIKAVIFDLGRVLVDYQFRDIVRGLSCYSPRKSAEMEDFFQSTPLWDTFERGKISPQDFFAEIQKALALQTDYDSFVILWSAIFTEKAPTVKIVQSLKGRIPLGLLSNVNVLHWNYILENFDFMNLFEARIPSFEVGLRKPEKEIYQIALQRLGTLAEETVFIDDTPGHVEGARAVGLRGIVFQNPGQLAQELNGLL